MCEQQGATQESTCRELAELDAILNALSALTMLQTAKVAMNHIFTIANND